MDLVWSSATQISQRHQARLHFCFQSSGRVTGYTSLPQKQNPCVFSIPVPQCLSLSTRTIPPTRYQTWLDFSSLFQWYKFIVCNMITQYVYTVWIVIKSEQLAFAILKHTAFIRFFMHMSGLPAYMYVCVPHVFLVSTEVRRGRMLDHLNWRYGLL